MVDNVRCVDCAFADWQRTASGRIKKNAAGRCLAALPDLPVILCVQFSRPAKLGLWTDDPGGRCDLFKPLGGPADET